MSSSTKDPHWFPYFEPDTLLFKDIAYQTYVHGVATSIHTSKKGLCPLFPLSTGVYKIENFK